MTTGTNPIKTSGSLSTDTSTQARLPTTAARSKDVDTLKSAKESESCCGCCEWLLPSCIVSGFRYIGSLFISLWECLFGQEKAKTPSLRKQRTLIIDENSLKKAEMLPREKDETGKDETDDAWIVRSEFKAGINLPTPQQMLDDIERIMNNKILSWLEKEPSQLESFFPCRVVVRADLQWVDLAKKQRGLATGKLGSLYQKGDEKRLQTELEEFRDLLLSHAGKIRHYTIEFMHIQKSAETCFCMNYSMFGCKMGSPSLVLLPEYSKILSLENLNTVFADGRSILATDLVDEHGNLSTTEL